VRQIDTLNPITIAFSEWLALLRDLRAAKSLREAAGYLFAKPGWSPDGRHSTSTVLRARASASQGSPLPESLNS
jgi:hypothetical protein